MKNLDLFSRRILSVSAGISMVILCTCVLIISLKSVTTASAENIEKTWIDKHDFQNIHAKMTIDTLDNAESTQGTITAVQVFGIGIRDGNLYFGILYSDNSLGLHKAPADGEDVLEW
jgi:hypothetical protein